ncbi:MauE/DoxX family redox-associated membrane protein [Blastomonas fulva]|uniref:Methylamine utilization protein MauE n=1 Tax=Blastomonas fulva TaxID=1550728 RepID=A0ABM6M2Y6_9SPHN|nr:glutaredoxin [Blastomonas fulva]ASR50278.1 glutaredoxin [Blastomonas fulva]
MTCTKTAVLHRMVMEKHICPYGLKSKYLLEQAGFTVDDRWLTSREQTDAFKAQHGVKTTPQTFIEGVRIGGNDDLRRHLGKSVKDPDAVSYVPVLAIFAMAALMALAISWVSTGTLLTIRTGETFIAVAMCLLAVPKLQDVDAFATMFMGYDLLARRWVPYAYIYPYAEALAGILMLARALDWIAIPTALFIGGIGAVSVYYAVYIQKRDIKCACVGGSSRVPLGFVSLTENVMMVAMAIWMLVGHRL